MFSLQLERDQPSTETGGWKQMSYNKFKDITKKQGIEIEKPSRANEEFKRQRHDANGRRRRLQEGESAP